MPIIKTKTKTVRVVCNVSCLVGQITFLISTLDPWKNSHNVLPLRVWKKITRATTTDAKIIKTLKSIDI